MTSGDFVETSPQTTGGGVWLWQVMDAGGLVSPTPDLPQRSVSPWGADRILAATLDLEDMWAGVINQAVTKIAVRGWEISDSDDSTRRTRRSQDLIMNFDGAAEYRSGMNKLVQDFLLTRNGCFVEVERESKSPASRPRALWHLDSLRCRRTGNLDYPVVYWDLSGSWHALRASDVIFFADMPSPRQNLYGVGRPAAERAFKTIVKLAAVETYFREKITGARALKLVFISGVSKKKMSDVAATADAEMERKGWTVYKGVVMVPVETDDTISVAEVDLASVPDGFSVETERRDAYLRYANAVGIPAQDIQPLSGQGLGTGTQTVILDEAAEGRGITYFVRTIEDRLNWLLMPKTTTFVIKTNDLRDRKAEAELKDLQAGTILKLVGTAQAPGLISKDQGLNMATDQGLTPKEFLPEDITPEGTVTDSGAQSKPAGEQDSTQTLAPFLQQPVVKAADKLTEDERVRLAQRIGNIDLSGAIIKDREEEDARPIALPLQQPATKATNTDKLIDAELAAALDWARKAQDAH